MQGCGLSWRRSMHWSAHVHCMIGAILLRSNPAAKLILQHSQFLPALQACPLGSDSLMKSSLQSDDCLLIALILSADATSLTLDQISLAQALLQMSCRDQSVGTCHRTWEPSSKLL